LTNHIDTGKQGEHLAVQYLTEKAFAVIHTNWRHARYEIDIIASHKGVLHFIEVKTRRSGKFGFPEESVTDKKLQNLINAAEAFLTAYPEWKRVQFDVLSITLTGNKAADYFFIEDVYL
jgi:putative endonuclease